MPKEPPGSSGLPPIGAVPRAPGVLAAAPGVPPAIPLAGPVMALPVPIPPGASRLSSRAADGSLSRWALPGRSVSRRSGSELVEPSVLGRAPGSVLSPPGVVPPDGVPTPGSAVLPSPPGLVPPDGVPMPGSDVPPSPLPVPPPIAPLLPTPPLLDPALPDEPPLLCAAAAPASASVATPSAARKSRMKNLRLMPFPEQHLGARGTPLRATAVRRPPQKFHDS